MINIPFKDINEIKNEIIHGKSYYYLLKNKDEAFKLEILNDIVSFVWIEYNQFDEQIGQPIQISNDDLNMGFKIGDRLDKENSYIVLDWMIANQLSHSVLGLEESTKIEEILKK